MKIGSTVLLLIPYRFHIIFEPAHLRIACRQVRLSVCRQAGTPADRSAGKLDGRLAGQRAYAYMLLFIAPFFCCFITTLIDGCIVPPIYIIQALPLKIRTPLLILLFEVLLL